jgi:hypothetical protein
MDQLGPFSEHHPHIYIHKRQDYDRCSLKMAQIHRDHKEAPNQMLPSVHLLAHLPELLHPQRRQPQMASPQQLQRQDILYSVMEKC